PARHLASAQFDPFAFQSIAGVHNLEVACVQHGPASRCCGISRTGHRARQAQSQCVAHQNRKPSGGRSKLDLIGIPIDLEAAEDLMTPRRSQVPTDHKAWMKEVCSTDFLAGLISGIYKG